VTFLRLLNAGVDQEGLASGMDAVAFPHIEGFDRAGHGRGEIDRLTLDVT